ncbi:MAG: purine-binding chemotaxis protein CheW [Gammaproteobacteria bacterium]|nr:purine-binding chemotaxis protein CheW [Gammaproteobacteria bacterium]
MMLLLFFVDEDRYGLDVTQVVEVIPCVTIKKVPRVPEYVTGLLNYHGKSVPVIDLTALMCDRLSHRRLSTRIILVNYHDENHVPHLLGVMAERVISTIKLPESSFFPSGIESEEAAFLGDVVVNEEKIVHLVNVNKLLTVKMRDLLFSQRKNNNHDMEQNNAGGG